MNIELVLDHIALLALIATVGFLAVKRGRGMGRDQIFILSGILILRLVRDLCNVLSWSGIYPELEYFEDYPGLLEPLCWAFLFYSFVQHKNQNQLAEKERKYRFLTESMSDVLWSASLDGRVTYMSPSVERFRGVTVEESMGTSVYNDLTPASRKRALSLLANELSRDSMPDVDLNRNITLELEQIHRDGRIIWSEVNVSFLRDGDNAPIGITGVTRDISERVKAEQERQQLEAQLRQTQKLEAIGMLAGGIAHDFNNVLFGIMGYCDLALDGLPQVHESAAFIQEIRSAGNRASDLVRQILTFARRSDRKIALIDIVPIIKEVVKLMRSVLPAGIEVKQSLPSGTCMVNADPTEIHQVLLNLCTNAGHALQETGGLLDIGLQRLVVPKGETQPATGLVPGNYLVITVADNGGGIPKEIISKIFEPFFTTKPKDEGTGMGLATVKNIVNDAGGMITVESEQGHGAEFAIYLPEAISQEPIKKESEMVLPQGTERIAVVDDEPTLATMLSLILESLGYQVTSFTDSRIALSTIRTNINSFDLIITDQAMPGITGRELAGELNLVRPELPVIICTGYSPTLKNRKPTTEGVAAYAIKPLTTKDLATLVRDVLDR